ncbi:MAG: pyridoxal-phosphate dependent enzyme [Bauldia sp.]|nr:pyridoxal-phosphate dependent enzyme [Bauldia sp.]
MSPLIPSQVDFGARVIWKDEGRNPTGSQKDRAMSLALSHAVAQRSPAVVVASTGSAALSCAAYAARAGLPCVVLVPRGTPDERLAPIGIFGASVIKVDADFEAIEEILAGLDPSRWYQASTLARVNPVQAEAPKTIAFEIAHQLGRVPDWVVVPIGGGATLHGVWRGFVELRDIGAIDRLPRLAGVQSDRFDAVHRAFIDGLAFVHDIPERDLPSPGDTVMRNLKHRIPPDGDLALAAIRESGGVAMVVSDEEALEGQVRLADTDGVFSEPSSTAVVPAIRRLVVDGSIADDAEVVAVLTGSGMRETGSLAYRGSAPIPPGDVLIAMERPVVGE